ncbi:Golgi apparatus membrane protein tvp23 [Rhizophagus clarus]|uniref:Golgi apparatus membrane protein TVP23 n=1 Tax=Rhizophagus clarus TaxID=94130 RepID=A0A8H3QQT6_9GLOM|nr:Golgi apparatus membrane protein tvp23 [Rhizophagus clarus]
MESRANLLSGAAPFAGTETLEPDIEATQDTNARASQNTQTQSIWEQSSHPVALVFHLLFRTGAIAIYLFGKLFTDHDTFIFIICVLLLSFDFWTVKNVTGRLLVGLRWWNDIQPDGTNAWVFESRDPSKPVNPIDSRIFWISLYATLAIWLFLAFLTLFDPKWLIIVTVAITLNMANVIGYTQCDKDAKKKWATGFAARAANPNMFGRLFSAGLGRFFG